MKRLVPLVCFCLLFTSVFSQSEIAIIPEPVSIAKGAGYFVLPQSVVVESGNEPETSDQFFERTTCCCRSPGFDKWGCI